MLKEIINRRLVTCSPDAKISDAAKIMASEDIGCLLVLHNGKPRGLLTDRDIVLRVIAQDMNPDECSVENVMTESLKTVKETDGLFDCIETMHGAEVRRIPVVDDNGNAVGIVSFGDLLAILSKEFGELTERITPPLEEPKVAAA